MGNLLERYLQAVGQYLPTKGKDDTLAELRANLLAEMDGRVEELGRALNEDEVAAVLEKHGSPPVVAARYLPQQSLIGHGALSAVPVYVVEELSTGALGVCGSAGDHVYLRRRGLELWFCDWASSFRGVHVLGLDDIRIRCF